MEQKLKQGNNNRELCYTTCHNCQILSILAKCLLVDFGLLGVLQVFDKMLGEYFESGKSQFKK
jgi:hypothetical protein